ncbi:peptidoglycan-binding domain-containing protein [Kribbella sp. DT2]|uniref:peptidoglycan-binding domain-containing protein n=1 Tax=Kribbella sp. DT2 TaxID=3393427 RepID=UPI003CE852DD
MFVRTGLAVAALAAPLAFLPTAATAAPTPQCDGSRTVAVGNGWEITTPGLWESTSVSCNLVYGDFPHRNPAEPFGDPAGAIKGLQQTLNYCYGAKIVVNGYYGVTTRDAVKSVQRRYGVAADGIYGPQTRSAMNWRLHDPAKNIDSTTCYSPI